MTRPPRLNLLHLLFAPDGLRPFIANWEQVSQAVLARVRREAAVDRDPATQQLLESLQEKCRREAYDFAHRCDHRRH